MYTLLHTLLIFAHRLYAAFCHVCTALQRMYTDFFWCAVTASTMTEHDTLVHMLTRVKKIPKHLVIVNALCDQSFLDYVRIIGWCITLDIPYISFFDRNGKMTCYHYICCAILAILCEERKSVTISCVCVCVRATRRNSVYIHLSLKDV